MQPYRRGGGIQKLSLESRINNENNSNAKDFYAYWLCNIAGIGNIKIKALLSEFKTAKGVYDASENEIKRFIKGIQTVRFTGFDAQKVVESRQDTYIYDGYFNMKKKGILFTYPGRIDYPKRLNQIYDAPQILYYKGHLPDESPSVAIVGTRNCSVYGRQMAFMLGKELAGAGVQVISGLAAGIDTHGHNGAIASDGRTFAVLGSGVDVCYPISNIELYSNILEKGGILSEFTPGSEARPGHFPLRNRIISGLSDVVIVVEAKKRSGSLITVEAALDQNKEIMAVPGRVGDTLSEGCNYLIKQGAHMLVESTDVLDLLGMNNLNKNKKNNFVLASEEEKVYGSICLNPKSIHNIIEETGFDSAKVSQILLNLELINLVEEVSKNYYVRKA